MARMLQWGGLSLTIIALSLLRGARTTHAAVTFNADGLGGSLLLRSTNDTYDSYFKDAAGGASSSEISASLIGDNYQTFDLGFSFTYPGADAQYVSINENGWLAFSDTNLNVFFGENYPLRFYDSNEAYSTAQLFLREGTMAPFWADLDTSKGSVYVGQVAEGFAIAFEDVAIIDYNSGGLSQVVTFEVLIHSDASLGIEIAYGTLLFSGTVKVSVGWHDALGSHLNGENLCYSNVDDGYFPGDVDCLEFLNYAGGLTLTLQRAQSSGYPTFETVVNVWGESVCRYVSGVEYSTELESSPTKEFETQTSLHIDLSDWNDDDFYQLDLGDFAVYIFGQEYSSIFLHSSGLVTFQDASGAGVNLVTSTELTAGDASTVTSVGPFVAPMWVDSSINAVDGGKHYVSHGKVSSNSYAITYFNITVDCDPSSSLSSIQSTWQLTLTNYGDFDIIVESMPSAGECTTPFIGWSDGSAWETPCAPASDVSCSDFTSPGASITYTAAYNFYSFEAQVVDGVGDDLSGASFVELMDFYVDWKDSGIELSSPDHPPSIFDLRDLLQFSLPKVPPGEQIRQQYLPLFQGFTADLWVSESGDLVFTDGIGNYFITSIPIKVDVFSCLDLEGLSRTVNGLGQTVLRFIECMPRDYLDYGADPFSNRISTSTFSASTSNLEDLLKVSIEVRISEDGSFEFAMLQLYDVGEAWNNDQLDAWAVIGPVSNNMMIDFWYWYGLCYSRFSDVCPQTFAEGQTIQFVITEDMAVPSGVGMDVGAAISAGLDVVTFRDDGTFSVDLGFEARFYSETFDALTFNKEGLVLMVSADEYVAANITFPRMQEYAGNFTDLGISVIVPLWGSMDATCGGFVYAGSLTEEHFTMIFDSIPFRDGNGGCSESVTASFELAIQPLTMSVTPLLTSNYSAYSGYPMKVGWYSAAAQDGEAVCSGSDCFGSDLVTGGSQNSLTGTTVLDNSYHYSSVSSYGGVYLDCGIFIGSGYTMVGLPGYVEYSCFSAFRGPSESIASLLFGGVAEGRTWGNLFSADMRISAYTDGVEITTQYTDAIGANQELTMVLQGLVTCVGQMEVLEVSTADQNGLIIRFTDVIPASYPSANVDVCNAGGFPTMYVEVVMWEDGSTELFHQFDAELLANLNQPLTFRRQSDNTEVTADVCASGCEFILDSGSRLTLYPGTGRPFSILSPGSQMDLTVATGRFGYAVLTETSVEATQLDERDWNVLDFSFDATSATTDECKKIDFRWPDGSLFWPFYGRQYTAIQICPDGFAVLGLDQFQTSNFCPGQELGNGNVDAAVIAPFWTDLLPSSVCSSVRYGYDADDLIIEFYSPISNPSLGSYIRWQLTLKQCGDFDILVDGDFVMDNINQADNNCYAQGSQGNIVSMGWQSADGEKGVNVCSGGLCSECLGSLPVFVSVSSGLCSLRPEVTDLSFSTESGGKGGDRLNITISNIDSLEGEIADYRVRFDRPGATLGSIIESYYGVNPRLEVDPQNIKVGMLYVDTPQLELGTAGFSSANMAVEIDVRNGTTAEIILADRWDFSATWYEMVNEEQYDALSSVPADGGIRIRVQGYGFSSATPYQLQYSGIVRTLSGAEEQRLEPQSFDSSSLMCDFVSTELLICPGIPWGQTQPSTEVEVQLMSWRSSPAVPVRAMPCIDAACTGSTSSLLVPVVTALESKSTAVGGAGGGSEITVVGYGFDETVGYTCSFSWEGGEVSSPASYLSTTGLTCLTPVWGDIYEAGLATFSVLGTPTALTASSPDLAPAFSEFEFVEEWEDTTVSMGVAGGGDIITILGFGFRSESSYICEIWDPQTGYSSYSFDAMWIKPRLLTCTTREYQGSAVGSKRLRVLQSLSDGGHSSLAVFDIAPNDAITVPDYLNYTVEAQISDMTELQGYTWGGTMVSIAVYGLQPDANDYYVHFEGDMSRNEHVVVGPLRPTACDFPSELCLSFETPRWSFDLQADVDVAVSVKKGDIPLSGWIKYSYQAYVIDYWEVLFKMSIDGFGGVWDNYAQDVLAQVIADEAGVPRDSIVLEVFISGGRKLVGQDLNIDGTVIAGLTEAESAAVKSHLDDTASVEMAVMGAGLPIPSVHVSAVSSSMQAADYQCPHGYALQKNDNDVYSCVLCPSGTYCSRPEGCTDECDKCPVGADCTIPGTGIPQVLSGYWRAQPFNEDTTAYAFHVCVSEDACLGGAASECLAGHLQGSPLCGVCEESYYTTSDGTCSQCQGGEAAAQTVLLGLLVVTILLALCFAAGMRYYLKAIFDPRQEPPGYGKNSNIIVGPDPYQTADDHLDPKNPFNRKARRRSTAGSVHSEIAVAMAMHKAQLELESTEPAGTDLSCSQAIHEEHARIGARQSVTLSSHVNPLKGRRTSAETAAIQGSNDTHRDNVDRAVGNIAYSTQVAVGHAVAGTGTVSIIRNAVQLQQEESKTNQAEGGTTDAFEVAEHAQETGGGERMTEVVAGRLGAQDLDEQQQVEMEAGGGDTNIMDAAEEMGEVDASGNIEQGLSSVSGNFDESMSEGRNLNLNQIAILMGGLSSKMKVTVGFLQIFTSLNVTLAVTWPPALTKLMSYFKLIEINLVNIPGLSFSCFTPTDLYMAFIAAAITPWCILLVIFITYRTSYWLLMRRAERLRFMDGRIQWLRNKMLTVVLWLTLLIYPTVSRQIFQIMNCVELDDGESYLMADLSVSCNTTKHSLFMAVAAVACLAYTIGIPVAIFLALKKHRNNPRWKGGLAFLHGNYEPEWWYWEVYDMIRRMVLVGLIIFIAPGTATQVAIGMLLAFFSLAVHLFAQAYVHDDDDCLQSCALTVLALTYYCGLLLITDITEQDGYNTSIFNGFIVAINALLVLVIIPATVIYQFRLLGKKARVMITSFSPRGKKKTEPSKKKGGAPLHVNLHQANQPRTSLVVSSSGKLTAAEGSTTPCMSPANSRSTTPNHATRLLASTDSPKGGQLSPPPSTSQQ